MNGNLAEELPENAELAREVKAQSTNTKIVKTGAKAAANYFAPGVGGKVVDIASKTRVGNQILNTGGEMLSNATKRMPFGNKIQDTLNKADDAGVIDAADQALDVAQGGGAGKASATVDSAATNATTTGSNVATNAANTESGSLFKSPLFDDSILSSSSDTSGSSGSDILNFKFKINPFLIGFIGSVLLLLLVMVAFFPHATLDLTSGMGIVSSNHNNPVVTLNENQIENLMIYVGDSRVLGIQNDLNKSNITYIAESGKGYYWFSETAKTELSAYISADTQKFVVINLGINDLGNIDQYINIYNSIIPNYKNVKFYFVSVNPVNEELANLYGYTVNNSQIEIFNQELSSKFVNYIDVYSQIKDNFVTTDGIHYDAATNERIHKIIVDYIKQRSNVAFLDEYPGVKDSIALEGLSLAAVLGDTGIVELTDYIYSKINLGGNCTGIGVAGAAIGLINGLHNYGYHLPYYYGGGHGTNNGIDLNWGTRIEESITPKGNAYYYSGLDCSGFVNWTMNTAGVKGGTVAGGFTNYGQITEFEALSPGDVLDSDSHVIMVIENKGTYLQCAESTSGGVQFTTITKNEINSQGYRMIDMDSYYKNNCGA